MLFHVQRWKWTGTRITDENLNQVERTNEYKFVFNITIIVINSLHRFNNYQLLSSETEYSELSLIFVLKTKVLFTRMIVKSYLLVV